MMLNMGQPAETVASLEAASLGNTMATMGDLPAEIAIELFSGCDFKSAVALSKTNTFFRGVFKRYFYSIIDRILDEDFAPKDAIESVIAWYLEETGGHTIRAIRDFYNNRPVNDGTSSIALRADQLETLHVCSTVKGWEAFFPALRFAEHHEQSRSLSDRETERLRSAVCNWWRYALLYHEGTMSMKALTARKPKILDVRANFLRGLPSAQLVELEDLWATLREAVASQLCPSIERVRAESDFEMSYTAAARVAWGNDADNKRIVSTMMKLHPGDLLHLLTQHHRYASKASLINAVKMRDSMIEASTESLSRALEAVLWDRRGRTRYIQNEDGTQGFPAPIGGILDFVKPGKERRRELCGNDGGKGFYNWQPNHRMNYWSVAPQPGLLSPPAYSY